MTAGRAHLSPTGRDVDEMRKMCRVVSDQWNGRVRFLNGQGAGRQERREGVQEVIGYQLSVIRRRVAEGRGREGCLGGYKPVKAVSLTVMEECCYRVESLAEVRVE